MSNLDFVAAEHGQKLGKGGNEKINDSLDILHHNGIYALFLWLHEAKEGREAIGKAIDGFLRDKEIKPCWNGANGAQDIPFYMCTDPVKALLAVRENLTKDLRTMFFIKDLIDCMLTYARHMAKVKSESGNGQ
jgi:hypothetical protein